jgi:hypothetical protein
MLIGLTANGLVWIDAYTKVVFVKQYQNPRRIVHSTVLFILKRKKKIMIDMEK